MSIKSNSPKRFTIKERELSTDQAGVFGFLTFVLACVVYFVI